MRLAKNPQNLQGMARLVEYAFNKNHSVDRDPLFLARYEHALGFGDFQAGKLASFVMANTFTSCLFNEKVKMAGVGYVASLPEYRGSGGIKALMTEMLSELYQEGYLISNLAPFSQNFYRRFGYENTIRQKKYVIQADAFTFLAKETTGEIVRGTWQGEQIKQSVLTVYQQVIAQNREVGTVARESWWWERLDQYYPRRFIAVVYENEVPTGYLIYRIQGLEFLVDELAYTTGLALRKCLNFMKAHVSSCTKFVYQAPVHEILEECFREQAEIAISIEPYMMSRIIDFAKLLTKIPFLQDDLIIEVTADEFCPWNIGKWHLTGNTCQKVSAGKAILSGSIQNLTAVLLGGQQVADSLVLGQLATTDPKKATQLIPQGRVSFYDYF